MDLLPVVSQPDPELDGQGQRGRCYKLSCRFTCLILQVQFHHEATIAE
jgi:hypothetical protein